VETIKTTPEQDMHIKKYLEKQVGNRGDYNLFFYNCRTFVRQIFERIKRTAVKADDFEKLEAVELPSDSSPVNPLVAGVAAGVAVVGMGGVAAAGVVAGAYNKLFG
jgi:hypothetical protein